MELIYSIIAFGSEEHLESIKLRREILRKPLGMDFTEEELLNEDKQFHLGCFTNNKLVGILVLDRLSQFAVKMRQVAVISNLQGKGVGKALVKFAEQWIIDNGYCMIFLNARKTAVPFYLALNYEIVSPEFLELDIPHQRMRKEL